MALPGKPVSLADRLRSDSSVYDQIERMKRTAEPASRLVTPEHAGLLVC